MKITEKIFLNDKVILGLIIVNSVVIFLQGFQLIPFVRSILMQADNIITMIFLLELVIKVKTYGLKKFIKSNWNIFDAVLILLAIPSLYFWFFNGSSSQLDYLLVLRISRIFKFFRFIRFFPDINRLIAGIQRALKASVIVLLGFLVYNFVISVLSCFFYKNIAPEYFANPLISFYSIFKIFTVEGWYEIPDQISKNSSEAVGILTKIYFVLILLTGGIFGLSLVNSIFVDAMVSDNNDELENKIESLEKKIDKLIENN
ncbi:ion transporter [Candidatus Peregrinibacteria bacterium]|nr:ion transporter [Candidatus Peregrinibacteria bacterium]